MDQAGRARTGFALVTLLYQQADWIVRRTEELTFDDALTVRRRSSIDLTLDRFDEITDDVLPVWGDRALLPVMLIARSTHYGVTVQTASGEPLPFLPRSEERDFLASGLAELSLRFDGADPSELDVRVALVRSIIERPPGHGVGDVDRRLESIAVFLKDFVDNHVVIATPRVDEVVEMAGGRRVARGLLRLIECHAESYPASRRKQFQIDGLRDALSQSPARASAYAGHRVEHPGDSLWERKFRLDDVAVTIPISQIDGAESFHVELVCPSGVYLEEAVLVSAVTLGPGGAIEVIEVAEDDNHWDAAHAHYARRLHSDRSIVRVDSVFAVVLRPTYHGLMHAGQNVSVLSAVLLWVLAFTIGWRASGWDHVIRVPVGVDDTTDSVVAMLLLAPTAALGLLVRHDEHLLTKHIASAYRRRLGALAAITFSAATVIATNLGGWQLFATLALAAVAGSGLAGATWYSARYSETRVRSSPVAPAWFTLAPPA